ncbi:hypothetical protein [Dongshaea marina]|uniref:hypothetical protein n=1 Tax=Dongshaea marina TaxID=2047966 RepID=UPI000D3E36B5|nr:hypothetical protein [Dongshaea marina]
MSPLCNRCNKHLTAQCGNSPCLIKIARAQKSLAQHQMKLKQARLEKDLSAINRHQSAIIRLQQKIRSLD